MSILIKGMEMPKTCDDCFLPLQYCPYAMKPNGECPLVPVPPHGRLIDADALVRDNGIKEIPEYYEVVRNAPTIILAEEGE